MTLFNLHVFKNWRIAGLVNSRDNRTEANRKLKEETDQHAKSKTV